MSLVKLSTGEKFEIESPAGLRDGIMMQRERKILPLTFATRDEGRFAGITAAFKDAAKTASITVFFPEEKEAASDGQLAGVAQEGYEGFTVPGEVKEETVMLEAGTPDAAPVYGRRLSIEMGQRQFGE